MRRSLFLSLLTSMMLASAAPFALFMTLFWFLRRHGNVNSWWLASAFLTTVILAGVLTVLMARHFSKPISTLAAAAIELTRGKSGGLVELHAPNEVGQLIQIFNYASQQLLAYENETRRLYKSIEESTMETMVLIANTIDRKDSATHGHSQRVSEWASEIGKELGLPEMEIRHLVYGGLLHDVGKIGVIEPILGKRSALTDEEMKAIRAHPTIGASIIASVSFLKPVIPAVRSHHERWDGSGYPEGLAGEAIPFMARVVGVADTWDALTSVRPYQKAMPSQKALTLLSGLKAKLFDPKVVEVFELVVRRKMAAGVRLSVADGGDPAKIRQ